MGLAVWRSGLESKDMLVSYNCDSTRRTLRCFGTSDTKRPGVGRRGINRWDDGTARW